MIINNIHTYKRQKEITGNKMGYEMFVSSQIPNNCGISSYAFVPVLA